MFQKTIFYLLSLTAILTFHGRSATAYNVTLTDGSNSATYEDDFNTTGNIGFNSWQVNSENLLTQTGWFYRLNNAGTAQPLDNLTETVATINSNSAILPYNDTDFTLDLNLSLNNIDSTLNQAVTVNNTSGSNLVFDLYFYSDIATSTGNTGDTVVINSSNYTATQSGTNTTITTTINETNTNYTERRAEVDAIDLNEDTLLNKLQFPASGNTPQLDGTLNVSSADYSLSTAYQWNYNLAAGESFEIGINSSVAVPFEFSPSLGMLLVGIFGGGYYLQQKRSS